MKTPHQIVWSVIDRIAEDRGISVSALARQAGLDATSFNISKRGGSRQRFPYLTTIIAVLKVCGMTWQDFAKLWDEESR